MGYTYFFTGFPGFIATSLMKQMIRNRFSIDHLYLLVLPHLIDKASEEIDKLTNEGNISREKLTIVPGDITKPHLNIERELNTHLQHHVTHIFHLAAVYDLAVPENIAYDVNVNGTKHMNEWVLTLSKPERYIYFSTAYVSGTREGRIFETELEMNQSFKNHYERTKYEAEKLVRGIISKVPTTIIRPGIVKGDSLSGETIKFDGPYFILNFFDKLKFFPVIPYLGTGKAEGNFVPLDYVLKAAIYLGHAPIGIGKTYHLIDPNPYTMKEVYRMLMEEFLGRKPIGMLPLSFAKWLLSIPLLRKWLRVEKEALDYFTCMAKYDCTQTKNDLQQLGITCPDFQETISSMVQFYEQHKNDTDKQLIID